MEHISRTELKELNNLDQSIILQGTNEYLTRRKRAVDLYSNGYGLKQIRELTGLRDPEIYRAIKRFSKIDADGKPLGTAALYRSKRTQQAPGLMRRLQEVHPEIIDATINTYFNIGKQTAERNRSKKSAHKAFLRACRAAGITSDQFPFSSADEGYRTFCRFLDSVSIMGDYGIRRFGKDEYQKFTATGFGQSTNLIPCAPYDVVELDGHRLDAFYSIDVPLPNGDRIKKTVYRPWLIVVIDVATRAILGYTLSPYENYNQDDVLTAIRNSITPHIGFDFQYGFNDYPRGYGYPNEAFPECVYAGPSLIMLDNAKSHLSENVIRTISDTLHCAINYSSVATPEARPHVERFFRTFTETVSKRLPSTSGSNPDDPKRRDPETNAITHNVSYDFLEELVEYAIAKYNNSSHDGIYGQTPMECMRQKLYDEYQVPVKYSSEQMDAILVMNYRQDEVTISGGYKKGEQPFFRYMKARYHAIGAMVPMSYIGKKCIVRFDPEHINRMSLYDQDGMFIAEMIASGERGRYDHSLRDRIFINEYENEQKKVNPDFDLDMDKILDDLKRAKQTKKVLTKTETLAKRLDGQAKPQKAAPLASIPDDDHDDVLTEDELDAFRQKRNSFMNYGYKED